MALVLLFTWDCIWNCTLFRLLVGLWQRIFYVQVLMKKCYFSLHHLKSIAFSPLGSKTNFPPSHFKSSACFHERSGISLFFHLSRNYRLNFSTQVQEIVRLICLLIVKPSTIFVFVRTTYRFLFIVLEKKEKINKLQKFRFWWRILRPNEFFISRIIVIGTL